MMGDWLSRLLGQTDMIVIVGGLVVKTVETVVVVSDRDWWS